MEGIERRHYQRYGDKASAKFSYLSWQTGGAKCKESVLQSSCNMERGGQNPLAPELCVIPVNSSALEHFPFSPTEGALCGIPILKTYLAAPFRLLLGAGPAGLHEVQIDD